MAAFVGNHAVVALINNYVPMSDVTQYTQPSGLEKEAKLPSPASKPLYDLIMQVWKNSNAFRYGLHNFCMGNSSNVLKKVVSYVSHSNNYLPDAFLNLFAIITLSHITFISPIHLFSIVVNQMAYKSQPILEYHFDRK